MPLHLTLILTFVFVCGLSGAEATPDRSVHWSYLDGKLPEAWNALKPVLSKTVKTPDGDPVLEFTAHYDREALQWPSVVSFQTDIALLKKAEKVEVNFWAKADQGAQVDLRVSDNEAQHLSQTASEVMTGEWRKISFRRKITAPIAGDFVVAAPRLMLMNFKAGQTLCVGPMDVRIIYGDTAGQETAGGVKDGWKPLDVSALYVTPGTALDFTPFADPAPAGAHGRLIVNKKGESAFSERPDVPVRFLSVQFCIWREVVYWSDQDIKDYAAAVARQGYNMVRFHFYDDFLNQTLRRGASLKNTPPMLLPQTPEEIDFDSHALDRGQLLLAELKKRGVYWNMDLMTGFGGYNNGRYLDVNSRDEGSTKAQLFVNPEFRANWRAGVMRLLEDVNPYTGLAMKDDPALALVSFFNEQEILFPHRRYGRVLDGPWHAFLNKKYGSYAALQKAWGGKCGDVALPADGVIEQVPSISPVALTDTPAGRDMAEVCGAIEKEMTEFYLGTLKAMKFNGLSTNWNMRTRIGTVPARSLLPVISMNSYHAHPDWGKNTTVPQDDSLRGGGNSFKNQTLARFLDRPFFNTEYGHVFWNRFRHEQGTLHGVGAALQGWDALTLHEGSVRRSGAVLRWFDTGSDPVARASEVVAAFAFRRADVTASTHTIEVPLTDEFIFAGRGMQAIDDEISRLWPLCRIGISYGTRHADFKTTLSVSPDRMSSIGGGLWFSDVEASSGTARSEQIVKKLRELKVLLPGNQSDPARGIYQSDTNEVLLNLRSAEMEVRTPRLEGVVLKRDHSVCLDALSVVSCSVPASITLIALDQTRSIREAKRLLLVFATDAQNSGMKFFDDSNVALESLGKLPVIVQTGRLHLNVARTAPDVRHRAYALHLNGERAEEVPVMMEDGKLVLDIDTAALAKAGATPFFEITTEL